MGRKEGKGGGRLEMGERKLLPKEVTHPKVPRYARQLD